MPHLPTPGVQPHRCIVDLALPHPQGIHRFCEPADIIDSLARHLSVRRLQLQIHPMPVTLPVIVESDPRTGQKQLIAHVGLPNHPPAAQQSLLACPNVDSVAAGTSGGGDASGERGGRLSFLEEDAFRLGRILDERQITAVDAIVSSLPLGFFSPGQRRDLFALVKDRLVEGGVFVQYRYTPKGIRELQPFFARIHRRFVPHLLPAWVFVCGNAPRSTSGY